ncbi:MAG: CapA family protein [Flammeovirgaceae bacterium]|nr:CapA family protein [Flammeovirgaceae bacterium]
MLLDKNGIRIALLNYTFSTNGLPVKAPAMVNMIDTALIRKDLEVAKSKNPDAIVVFTHWGAEYVSQPNMSQKRIAEFCFKHGVKLVIGSHPHTLQPMEWRKESDQLVAYSLGNFISNLTPRFKDNGGMMWVDLSKITEGNKSATSIHDAGYELNWVYKTPGSRPEFYTMPAAAYEDDTLFIAKTKSIELANFCKEARSLLGKYNVEVNEMSTVVTDIFYEIEIDGDSVKNIPQERFYFFWLSTGIPS